MKIKCLLASIAFSSFSAMSYAQDISQGVVVEGESLPVGIAIGDTRQDVENSINSFSEFDLYDPEKTDCDIEIDRRCKFTATDINGEELGFVTVYFSREESPNNVSSLRWSFKDWVTSAGLSLRDLETVSEDELFLAYPDARRAAVHKRSRSSLTLLRVPVEGVTMVYRSSTRGTSSYGMVHTPY